MALRRGSPALWAMWLGAAALLPMLPAHGSGSQGCASAVALPPGVYSNATWPVIQYKPDGTPVARTYRFTVPPQALEGGPLPVVFDLHGNGSESAEQEIITAFTEKGVDEGFIVVQPDLNFSFWAYRMQWTFAVSDVEFTRSLLEILNENFCIDSWRIHAAGYSAGGSLATRLACEGARGALGVFRFASVAPVAGGPDGPGCSELAEDPVPMRMIVSNNDLTVSFRRLISPEEMNELFRQMATQRATDNGCGDPASELTGRTGWGVLAETVTFDCDQVAQGRADTILDFFDTGDPQRDGHAWPGRYFGGEYPTTDVIWDFFESHPRAM